ncbi:MAG: hypothetical protein ETSY2_22565 [Candidatus Entotheonella gemina]|uniref:SGNH hydrolase-type esterase domain-containing protein n=2 Tax=Candidatus Entotheonella TaxID=93171 RepID=W4M5L9_9BACT|nr:MAG: hypothetical protein ETSY2_22565 [Candidatus Entotheonella gemina]
MRDQSKQTGKFISRRKKIIFTLITCLFVFACVDTLFYVFLNKLKRNHNVFHEDRRVNQRVIDAFYENYFHADWGWDIPKPKRGALGNRTGQTYGQQETYKIKTFGDSFVYGFRLADEETFQSCVEQKSGWSCLNYGVDGFGTDQAFLKYQENRVPSQYTILGILDENIARVVATWWSFYSFRDVNNIVGTKPRFIVQNDKFVLSPNPIGSYQDLQKLHNADFIETLKDKDYWPYYHWQTNAPPHLRWPAMATLLPHLNFFVRNVIAMYKNRFAPTYESETSRRRFYHLYRQHPEALKIMKYIIREFVHTAQQRGEIPIILIFPIKDSMQIIKTYRKKPYQELVSYLQHMSYNFIDFGDVFLQEDHKSLYFKNDFHLSAKGNERVADELIRYIKELEF